MCSARSPLWLSVVKLKSDQDGIESFHHLILQAQALVSVEIRPRWDWKQDMMPQQRRSWDSWNQTKMGLKDKTALANSDERLNSWNQTKMGLKVPSPRIVRFSSTSLKSDQDGIERVATLSSPFHLRECWNQTKMGLKVSHIPPSLSPFFCWNQTKMGLKAYNESAAAAKFTAVLKSDQDGIERAAYTALSDKGAELKSDQDGIERFDLQRCEHAWIPKLKSDQDGIESQISSTLTPSRTCWNQTKMGLKGFGAVRINIFQYWVEIRPRWDWKLNSLSSIQALYYSWNQTKMGLKDLEYERSADFLLVWLKSDQDGIERICSASLTREKNRWNQTKMGLKETPAFSPASCRAFVEIRPRWDWKQQKQLMVLRRTQSQVEIRPRWDWKAAVARWCARNARRGWNQTKMGLKGLEKWGVKVHQKGVEIRPRWDWKARRRGASDMA